MASEQIDFLLDLDSDAFASKVTDAIDTVRNLQENLTKVATIAGVVGAAYLALKTSLSLAFEAENIKSLHTQFDILSTQAGIAGDQVLAAMQKASDGLLDAEDTIQLANRAMVQLGSQAARMPEIMDIARRASVVMGTDISQAFEMISQSIATGQTRALKQLGVVIDTEKAYRDYASSVGVAANALSEQGKVQAIANVAIEQMKTKLSDVDTSVKKTTDSWTRFKIQVGEVKDAMALAFGPSAGGFWQKTFDSMADSLSRISTEIVATFGQGKDRVEALRKTVNDLTTDLEKQKKAAEAGGFWQWAFGDDYTATEMQLKGTRAQLALLEEEQRKRSTQSRQTGSDPAPVTPAAKADPIDREQVARNQAQFRKDLVALQQEKLQAEMATNMQIEQVEGQFAQRKALLEEQTAIRIAEIKNNPALNPIQREQEIGLIREAAAAREVTLATEVEQAKIAALDRYALHAESSFDRVAATQQASAMRGAQGQRQSVNLMKIGLDAFGKHAQTAFQELGAGTKSGAEVMRSIFFGVLGDMAVQQGAFFMAQYIASWGTNVPALAGATALFTLAGFLKSQGGGAGSSAGGGAAAAAGGGAMSSFSENSMPAVSEERQKKSLNVIIEGNYFDTEQTRRVMVEMIQSAQDATDISISSVGGR